MKMVKSLLLGSAAGLVAIAGAQAADLPVKAKPVQYVKICSLYGVGFYYIPGTDMCIKVGGWVREEIFDAHGGSGTTSSMNGQANSRATNNFGYTARGYITADARNQTAYGTVRAYIAVGLNTNTNAANLNAANYFSANRAFIQWAGFTFGLAQSFFDFYSTAVSAYWGDFPASDTGDPGWTVAAYTAQFGNGLSATISAEDARRTQIIGIDTSSATGFIGGTTAPGSFQFGTPGTATAGTTNVGQGAYGGAQAPDVVGNVRLDQTWGSVQAMAAWHLVNAAYYAIGTSNTIGGHPTDKSGWAAGVGLKLNAPMIGQGDFLQTEFAYSQGAMRYIFRNPNNNWGAREGMSNTFGVLSDAVYAGATNATTNTGLDLTSGWHVDASYEHFWNSQWRTSVYGGYGQVSYNAEANANLCTRYAAGNATGVGTLAVANAACNNDWSTWWLGSRTQWNVTPDFYMGVDVMYLTMNGASVLNNVANTNNTIGTTAVSPLIRGDDHDVQVKFRVHKDFYP